MFENIVPGKAAETMAVFGRGKMLPPLDMPKDEVREHSRSLIFVEFLVCLCHMAKSVLPTNLKKPPKSNQKLEDLVTRLLQSLALAYEFPMEFPPEPDYDLNQFFSDDSGFDSDPEIERPPESESEASVEEAAATDM